MDREPSSQVNPCIKYALFILNFIVWLVAIGLMGFGIYSELLEKSDIGNVLDFFLNPAIFLILLGSIIFVTTFIGCIGALRDNISLLLAFRIIMTVLLILELLMVIVVVLFFFVPQVRESLSFLNPAPILEEAIERYKDDPNLGDTIDEMQKALKCCGASNDDNGYKDWDLNLYFNCTADSPSLEACGVPSSCCIVQEDEIENSQCGYNVRRPENVGKIATVIYLQGCVKGIGQFLSDQLFLVIGIGAAILIPQMVILCLTNTMSRQIKFQNQINERNAQSGRRYR